MAVGSAAVVAGGSKNESGTAGGGGNGGKPLKLAFVTNNASDFWKIAQAGVRKYEDEGRCRSTSSSRPNGTTEEQNQIIENLVSQGTTRSRSASIAPTTRSARSTGRPEKTKLVTFDSDSPKSNRLLYIGTNNYEAGKVLGRQIVKLLPQGGKMACSSARCRPTTRPSGSRASRTRSRQEHRDRREAGGQHRPS
jgi:ribose transport system substrate-binding protein